MNREPLVTWNAKIQKRIGWVLSGFLIAGALLDAISNAITLINPFRATLLTFAIWGVFGIIQLLVQTGQIRISYENGSRLVVRKIGVMPFLFLIGLTVLFWVPTFVSPVPAVPTREGTKQDLAIAPQFEKTQTSQSVSDDNTAERNKAKLMEPELSFLDLRAIRLRDSDDKQLSNAIVAMLEGIYPDDMARINEPTETLKEFATFGSKLVFATKQSKYSSGCFFEIYETTDKPGLLAKRLKLSGDLKRDGVVCKFGIVNIFNDPIPALVFSSKSHSAGGTQKVVYRLQLQGDTIASKRIEIPLEEDMYLFIDLDGDGVREYIGFLGNHNRSKIVVGRYSQINQAFAEVTNATKLKNFLDKLSLASAREVRSTIKNGRFAFEGDGSANAKPIGLRDHDDEHKLEFEREYGKPIW